MSKAPNLKRQAIEQRSRARRQLLQLLYQWQLSNDEPALAYQNRIIDTRLGDIDEHYFDESFQIITQSPSALEAHYAGFMARKMSTLDPIERAVLWIGAYELLHRPDIHSTVVINEAVELAKQFGGEDGYKFINGILDKFAKSLAAQSLAAKSQTDKKADDNASTLIANNENSPANANIDASVNNEK